jgi:hypothetical protein
VKEKTMGDDVYEAIRQERAAQDARWGGPEHDDQHSNFDWIAYIAKHVGRAVQWPFDRDAFRRQMVIVAALAVAAIEWADRGRVGERLRVFVERGENTAE